MSRHLFTLPALLSFASLALAHAPTAKLPPAASRKVDFTRDIQPILKRSCLSCHGPDKKRGGLRLDSAELARKGGDSGQPPYRPGDSFRSKMIHLVAGLDPDSRMPPKKDQALSNDEIGLLRAWIDQGADWPKDTPIAAGGKGSKHWAFQPIRRPELPSVADRAWPRSAIDSFVLARLEKEKIAPSPEADRVTLMRRVCLDLVGLPPPPEEVDEFLADTSPDAYEKLVDRLLASPHYGERWGRHWLDSARYADSDGFEKDGGRPFAWRYRHYVIAALNRNVPYDQLIIEQLAGDLLPGGVLEQKVATGFHRNTLTNREGGVDAEQYRVETIVDRVNTTARVFLGLTLGCAQCHDHKYDPLSQREYYQFFAFFNSDAEASLAAPVISFRQPVDDNLLPPKKRETLLSLQEDRRVFLTDQLLVLEKTIADGRPLVPVRGFSFAKIREIMALPPETRTPEQKKYINDYLDRGATQVNPIYRKIAQEITTLRKATQGIGVHAQVMTTGRFRPTNVMIRGDFRRKGIGVAAGTPAVLPPLKARSPNRLDLARWIADKANPLTARVAVNWIWHKYFGAGLVRTLGDFGAQGEKPSHPELLDYLADELMRRNWDLKEMHRLIVTSATYRQSSKVRPVVLAVDPYNALLSRQARLRLEAEVIRDNALTASGLLVRVIGGPSVKPPQPQGISELTYAFTLKWVESKGMDRYRRGLYTWFQRTSPYPMLLTFDGPDSTVCCVKRERSNTPLQALTLLNDSVFVECAQALAQRVLRECPGDTEKRIKYAFRLCLARSPTATEIARLKQLYGELLELCLADLEGSRELVGAMKPPVGMSIPEAAAWMAVGRTLLNLDEMVTRE
jgi:mono/diheme cytochrome c family protein